MQYCRQAGGVQGDDRPAAAHFCGQLGDRGWLLSAVHHLGEDVGYTIRLETRCVTCWPLHFSKFAWPHDQTCSLRGSQPGMTRVAAERSVPLGEDIGYTIRLETRREACTTLHFVQCIKLEPRRVQTARVRLETSAAPGMHIAPAACVLSDAVMLVIQTPIWACCVIVLDMLSKSYMHVRSSLPT